MFGSRANLELEVYCHIKRTSPRNHVGLILLQNCTIVLKLQDCITHIIVSFTKHLRQVHMTLRISVLTKSSTNVKCDR